MTITPVNVYDIDWDLNWRPDGEPRTPWDQIPAVEADDQLVSSRETGETASEQEYLTTAREGQQLRIVLLKVVPEAGKTEDLGVVYVYTL
jgi:hypothetical protein